MQHIDLKENGKTLHRLRAFSPSLTSAPTGGEEGFAAFFLLLGRFLVVE
jgi:hypothetical protein